jgi:hypothetical protein
MLLGSALSFTLGMLLASLIGSTLGRLGKVLEEVLDEVLGAALCKVLGNMLGGWDVLGKGAQNTDSCYAGRVLQTINILIIICERHKHWETAMVWIVNWWLPKWDMIIISSTQILPSQQVLRVSERSPNLSGKINHQITVSCHFKKRKQNDCQKYDEFNWKIFTKSVRT